MRKRGFKRHLFRKSSVHHSKYLVRKRSPGRTSKHKRRGLATSYNAAIASLQKLSLGLEISLRPLATSICTWNVKRHKKFKPALLEKLNSQKTVLIIQYGDESFSFSGGPIVLSERDSHDPLILAEESSHATLPFDQESYLDFLEEGLVHYYIVDPLRNQLKRHDEPFYRLERELIRELDVELNLNMRQVLLSSDPTLGKSLLLNKLGAKRFEKLQQLFSPLYDQNSRKALAARKALTVAKIRQVLYQ